MKLALTVLAAAAVSLPALASAHGGRRGGGACKADVQRLCADQLGDRKAVRQCLKANQDQLSEACAARVEKRQARRQAFKAACQGDVQRLCGDVEPGQGRIKRCLRENQDQLSAECRAQAKKVKRGKRGKRAMRRIKRACGADIQQPCGDVQGRRGLKRCMREHADELSAECSAAVEKLKRRGRKGKGVCKADRQRLCADVEPGQGRVRACLQANQDQLSPACAERLEARQARKARRANRDR